MQLVKVVSSSGVLYTTRYDFIETGRFGLTGSNRRGRRMKLDIPFH